MIDAIWVDNLIKIFEYENKLYEQILEKADYKTDLIIKGDVDSLQEMVVKEQKIINELEKLENAREQIVAQIARKAGKKSEELTVSYLIELLPRDKAEKLSSVRDSLKKTIEKLQSQNDLNQKLINNAMDYVNFSLNLLTQPKPTTAQYGRNGLETQMNGGNMLDIKY